MFISAVITAGGVGKRFGGQTKKQFMLLKNRPVLFWTIDNFYKNSYVNEIVIVLPKDSDEFKEKILEIYTKKTIKFAENGKERQNSVFNALNVCNPKTDYVMIQDGVRIFLSDNEIERLIDKVQKYKKVILVKKINDTIKKVDNDKIISTVDRKQLYSALTPQVFDYDLIYNLHKRAKSTDVVFTDDASICEHFNEAVFIVETDEFNIKITKPADLLIAESIIDFKEKLK